MPEYGEATDKSTSWQVGMWVFAPSGRNAKGNNFRKSGEASKIIPLVLSWDQNEEKLPKSIRWMWVYVKETIRGDICQRSVRHGRRLWEYGSVCKTIVTIWLTLQFWSGIFLQQAVLIDQFTRLYRTISRRQRNQRLERNIFLILIKQIENSKDGLMSCEWPCPDLHPSRRRC